MKLTTEQLVPKGAVASPRHLEPYFMGGFLLMLLKRRFSTQVANQAEVARKELTEDAFCVPHSFHPMEIDRKTGITGS